MMSPDPTTQLIRAAAVCDAGGINARPGCVCVSGGRIVAAGSVDFVRSRCGSGHRVLELPDALILPAMVNAHAHLELSGIGPRPYPGCFTGWLKGVIRDAPKTVDEASRAVARGIGLSRGAGVLYVGDVTRWPECGRVRLGGGSGSSGCSRGLPGVAYVECFGIGVEEGGAVDRLGQTVASMADTDNESPEQGGVGWGLQPHAPYSAGLGLYDAAGELARAHGLRLSTHLAETTEEVRFVRDAEGPFVDLLKDLDKWDGSIRATGLHPIDWLSDRLAGGGWVVAHCNYVDDVHVEVLRATRTSVAYCPVASDYFGHHRPDEGVRHRYRDMLDAGVNVCLGTDSLGCQSVGSRQPLSILEQMRHLYRRDGTPPLLLLRMGTVHGAAALRVPPVNATLGPGAPAVVNTVRVDPSDATDPLTQALRNNHPVRPLALTA